MVKAAVLNRHVAAKSSSEIAAGRPLRLLLLASKLAGQAPSQRFRLEQWAPHLSAEHYITMDLLPYESPRLTEILYQPGHHATKAGWVIYDFIRRAKSFLSAQAYDAVVIHREAALIGPPIYEHLIALSGKPIIFDFDDSIWQPQGNEQRWLLHLRFPGKTKSICRVATAVTAGNQYLADYACKYNRNTMVVPTSIDLDAYPVSREPVEQSPFVVCWTGSYSTLAHFELAREALERLAAQIPLTVKVICNRPPERPIAGAQTHFVPWSSDGEAREIGDSHVGIMPLPDDEFSRGKCGLKALQCMATGRPVVISPVGMNSQLVRPGENGFLASTTEDYVAALMQLAQSRELRTRLGANARKTVEDSYSASATAARFARVVRSIFVAEDGSLT